MLNFIAFPSMSNLELYPCYYVSQSVLFEFIDGADFNKEISRSSLIDLNAKKRTTRIYCSVEILAKKMEVALGLAYQRSGILIKNASNLI